VEGVGPTKPAPKQQRGQRVTPRPIGDGARKPKAKHPARKGKPQGAGQGRGGPGGENRGGQRRRNNRSGGARSGGQG